MDYSYIIIPIIVLIATQTLKLITDSIKGNFDFYNLFTHYGGMPSSHTAFAASITSLVGFRLTMADPLFAVSLVFTLLIMRDAVAFRTLMGRQNVALNILLKRIPEKDRETIKPFRERMGHSILEVSAGALFSVLLTYLLHIISVTPGII